MNKLSYKTLLIIFFFLLICIVVLIKITSPIKKVSAAWWNENWSYRQAINISSHDTSESNVYITTTINIDPATKAQSDDGDFRFVDQTGNLLPYYVYSGVGTTNIVFHIQFSSFPSGAQTIYAYYGNSSATNGFSATDFTTQASNYTIGSLNTEEISTNYNSSESNFSANLGIQSLSPLSGEGSAIIFGTTTQTIGGTTTNLDYCIPGDTSACSPPIAEWKMEENAGTTAYDSSGNNNNGVFGANSAAPTWTVGQNNSGSGLKFDGTNDYVSSGKDLLTSSPMTICTWFKLNNTSQDSAIIGNFANNFWTSYGKGFKYTNGTLHLMCENNNDKETISTSLNDTNWHYACGIIKTSTGKLYLDGTEVASGDLNSDGYNYWTDIGAATWRNTENTKNFNGSIDQVRIYNYARTPAQIAYDYNKGAPIGWWKLDECQGSTVFDSSGLGNTGTISIGINGSQNTLGTCQVGTSAAWTNGASGKLNSSLNFDGTDDYINMGDPANGSLDFGLNDFSTSAWFKTNNNIIQLIQGKYNSWPLWYSRINTNGKIEARIAFDSGTSFLTNDGSVVTDNKWHNITVIYKRSGYLTKYLDGKTDGTPVDISSSSNTSINTNNKFVIGASGSFSSPFKGQVDDVRIYNYALTPTQIKTLYNNGAINFQ